MADTCPRCDWVAKRFHDAYELFAPEFNYTTRKASAVPWADVPENNKALMRATVTAVLNCTHPPELPTTDAEMETLHAHKDDPDEWDDAPADVSVRPSAGEDDVSSGVDDVVDEAWGLIANAFGGDWSLASDEWRTAAERWRDEQYPIWTVNPSATYHPRLSSIRSGTSPT